MALFAIAVPILPGKTDQWHHFIEELRGPRYREYAASRRRLDVRERAFLQSTPHGDVVVVTLEGENPTRAFRSFGDSDDPFTHWFVQQVQEIHGFDLRQPPPAMPEMAIDSHAD